MTIKRFECFAKCSACSNEEKVILEFKNGETNSFIEGECSEMVHEIVGNVVESGFNEINEKGEII